MSIRVPSLNERAAYIAECERAGRWVAAGVALINLREWQDATDPTAFATTAAQHTGLAPERIAELLGCVLYRGGILRCTGCGVASGCHCGCGAPYLPEHRWTTPAKEPAPTAQISALARALAAIEANPEKSDRALAAEIGVSNQTVSRARRQMRQTGGDVTRDVTREGTP